MYVIDSPKSEGDFLFHLREMGMCQMSVVEEGFPFKIVLMNPDTAAEPHAHIYGLGKAGKEIGAFYLTKNPPQSADDLEPYEKGRHEGFKNIPWEWREIIARWAKRRSAMDPAHTNWRYMQLTFYMNAYAGKHNF